MNWLRARRRPTGRRAVVIAVVLSILMPGLGHAYALHLWRALIWFAGVIALSLVLERGEEDPALVWGMGAALAALAALDAMLVMWLDGRPPGRL